MADGSGIGYRGRMHFDLVDRVIERSDDRIVTLKLVTAAEEYLQDHFATFPVLPGVMMIEAMTQAARRLLETEEGPPLVLGGARGIKYGSFVKPGSGLRVEVSVLDRRDDGSVEVSARATVVSPAASETGAEVAAGGRITLRPVRVE